MIKQELKEKLLESRNSDYTHLIEVKDKVTNEISYKFFNLNKVQDAKKLNEESENVYEISDCYELEFLSRIIEIQESALKQLNKDWYDYYIVKEDTFEENWDGEKELREKDTIYRVEENEYDIYSKESIDFFNNKCRKATQEEKERLFEEDFSNAALDYADFILHYFIPKAPFELDWSGDLDSKYGFSCTDAELGPNQEYLIINYNRRHAEQLALKYCRRATKEEVQQINDKVKEAKEEDCRKFRIEEVFGIIEKVLRYEENMSDANYFPGAVGNFNQVILPNKEKLYDLKSIKEFYKALQKLKEKHPDILKEMIFYGGTVPYILLNKKGNTRKFGDVDIFVPIDKMQNIRCALYSLTDFSMNFDSQYLTEKSNFIVGKRASTPLFYGEGMEAYREYEKAISRWEREQRAKTIYQDFGFKGNLFGVNISVFPIYGYGLNDNLSLCAKSFRVDPNFESDNYLLSTVVANKINVPSFYEYGKVYNNLIKYAPLEYTVASKMNAIQNGYKLRKETDEEDLKFIERNKEKLGINDDTINFYLENIPEYGIVKVFRVKKNYEIQRYNPESYKDMATRKFTMS